MATTVIYQKRGSDKVKVAETPDLSSYAVINGNYPSMTVGNAGQIVSNAVPMSSSVVDVSAGMVFTKTIAANTTISFSNVPASPVAVCVTLIITNGGAYTVTWPSSVKWNGGTAPDLTASGVDVLTFLTIDGGTTCYGTVNSLGAA